jgi:hypothetical protein
MEQVHAGDVLHVCEGGDGGDMMAGAWHGTWCRRMLPDRVWGQHVSVGWTDASMRAAMFMLVEGHRAVNTTHLMLFTKTSCEFPSLMAHRRCFTEVWIRQ